MDKGLRVRPPRFECNLICALQVCTEGFELADIENIMSEIDTDNVKGCRPALNDGNMRGSDVKFGGKRVRVCDVVDKGCVFALHDLTCARQSCMEGFQAAVTLNVVYEIDIFASLDHNFNIISLDHMKKRKTMQASDTLTTRRALKA